MRGVVRDREVGYGSSSMYEEVGQEVQVAPLRVSTGSCTWPQRHRAHASSRPSRHCLCPNSLCSTAATCPSTPVVVVVGGGGVGSPGIMLLIYQKTPSSSHVPLKILSIETGDVSPLIDHSLPPDHPQGACRLSPGFGGPGGG